MKLGFQFSNLFGVVYRKGNLLFTPDGNSLLSPVGNRVSLFNLVEEKTKTLPFENRKNIVKIAQSPTGHFLVSVDEDGRAILFNMREMVVLHYFAFKGPIGDIQFSPDSRYFAVSIDSLVQIWHVPTSSIVEFAPFVLYKTMGGHRDTITCLQWSSDSRFVLTGSKDMTCRIYMVDGDDVDGGYEPRTLAGQRDAIVRAFFSSNGEYVYVVTRDGVLVTWKWQSERSVGDDDTDFVDISSGKYGLESKHFFRLSDGVQTRTSCAYYSPATNILTVGFVNGVFGLYELPDFNSISVLSVSQNRIDSVCANASGEWIAFGCALQGQLLVWEWRSESYILKQQGHFQQLSCVSYSEDGRWIATGGDDGKVKVWNASTGFCFVTFTEHTGPVQSLMFSRKKVLISASLDGTVRAYDLIRYRNFRTFVTPKPVQFSGLAVDPSGEVICAGTRDSFEIFVWSMQTGNMLDVLAGHDGPISCLGFSPDGMTLASGSWDKTVRLWELFQRGTEQSCEILSHQTEVLALAFRPDNQELATSTLDGEITFWDWNEARTKGFIEGRKDIAGGRRAADLTASNKKVSGHAFGSLSYSADGRCILGGGQSRYLCIYDVSSKVLLRRYALSSNLSMDGLQDRLNSKDMTEAGPLDLIDLDPWDVEQDRAVLHYDRDTSQAGARLPGVAKGDHSERQTKPTYLIQSVQFSPTAETFAAATTEGLILYSNKRYIEFDPLDLDIDITPESIMAELEGSNGKKQRNYFKALLMAFRLGERSIVWKVWDGIPLSEIRAVLSDWPVAYIGRLMEMLAIVSDHTDRLEFWMTWTETLLRQHSDYLLASKKSARGDEYGPLLTRLEKAIHRIQTDLSYSVVRDNINTLKYLRIVGGIGEEEEDEKNK